MTETSPLSTIRHDGWTPERRARFLEGLAHDGNVRGACARVGLSREAAYRLRRREPAFARAWAAAQMLGREASAEVLGTRALDGIEEDVWYRGEVVGTRRRFDNRLLLAHVARLDKLAEQNAEAVADAERFDELVALACGVEPPGELATDGMLPLECEECMHQAMKAADFAVEEAWEAGREARERELDADRLAAEETAMHDRCVAAGQAAALEAEVCWDEWVEQACDTVDRLLAGPPVADEAGEADEAEETPGVDQAPAAEIASTLSSVSTSPAVAQAAEPEPAPAATAPTVSSVSTSPEEAAR